MALDVDGDRKQGWNYMLADSLAPWPTHLGIGVDDREDVGRAKENVV